MDTCYIFSEPTYNKSVKKLLAKCLIFIHSMLWVELTFIAAIANSWNILFIISVSLHSVSFVFLFFYFISGNSLKNIFTYMKLLCIAGKLNVNYFFFLCYNMLTLNTTVFNVTNTKPDILMQFFYHKNLKLVKYYQ